MNSPKTKSSITLIATNTLALNYNSKIMIDDSLPSLLDREIRSAEDDAFGHKLFSISNE